MAAARPRPRRRQPVWQEVEDRERRKVSNRVRQRRRQARRYAVVYDIDGPRVRLGVLWFALNVGALSLGLLAVTALYAATAGVAGLQTAKAWTSRGARPDRRVAGGGAALLPLAAAVSTGMLGLAVLANVGAAIATSSPPESRGGRARSGLRPMPLATAGYTLQCSLFAGLAAAALVITDRYEIGAAWTLVLLAAAYETGDFIVGSGAANPYEGPLAGIAAILVVTFTVSALGVPPFEFPSGFVFGAFAAVLCPLGQLFGSAVLPSAAAPAPGLRRIDSLLLLGPFWAFTIGLYVQSR